MTTRLTSALLSDREVSTYLVYRIKVNELLHLHLLWLSLHNGECGDMVSGIQSNTIGQTLRTAAMSWFSTILDKNGLDIFPIWEKMFPRYKRRIALYRTAIQPQLDILRKFRNKAAFHAEPIFSKFFAPRLSVRDHMQEIIEAVQHFLKLSAFLIRREHAADPDLQSRMLEIILDTELKLDCNIRRSWLVETNVIDRSSIFGVWRF